MMRAAALVAVSWGLLGACGESAPAPPVAVCGSLQTGPVTPHTQCGGTLDFTPINAYQGELASAQDREGAVALIGGDCTGTWIAAAAGPVVLTAGHCAGLGDSVLIAFNVEAEPDGDPLVTEGTVIEQALEPDYALIRLDQLPAVTPTALTTRASERLAIIQHPRGGAKVIAEGDLLGECQGVVSYTDLDTLVGSSGAGVLNDQGDLVAVHTDGDCGTDGGGSNHGWSAAGIVGASTYLQPGDLGDR
ncbi:MAG: serine protease [Kofleriaceae bacterium]